MMALFNDTSLFNSAKRKTGLDTLEDATLPLIESFFTKEEAGRIYTKLLKETAWKKSQITIYDANRGCRRKQLRKL
jgi:hypothetical protein